MRRSNSIYDNLNDAETTNLSTSLSANNNDDFDQMQTPNNTLNLSKRSDSFADEMDSLQKGMLEELESIKRMLSDVNLLFEKSDDTLERPKQERFPMKIISIYIENSRIKTLGQSVFALSLISFFIKFQTGIK